MSAIAGLMKFNGACLVSQDLEPVMSALAPFGPDRSHILTTQHIAFANLLMQMTPEDKVDCQPICGSTGAMITADIRLDNRDEIVDLIGLSKTSVQDWSDSRVVLVGWEKYGSKLWPLLRGPFAIAIWDPINSSLVLARDHLGLNALVWYRCRHFFAFATMPRGLFALGDVPRVLDEGKFADFLLLNHSELETTVYQGIYRVLPAHCLMVRLDGAIQTRRYWSSHDITPIRMSSDQHYAEMARERLQLAIKRQMRTKDPLGCLLSGGLDSSSIAALAADLLGQSAERLHTFTQVCRPGFDGHVPIGCYSDERPFVEELARFKQNIVPHYVTTGSCDDFKELEVMFKFVDGPIRNPMNLGWMLATRRVARSHGIRVLFGGRHGNFALSWDGWSQAADHFRRGHLIKAYQQWLLFYRSTSLSRWLAFKKLLLMPLLPVAFVNRRVKNGRGEKRPAWLEVAALNPQFGAELNVERRANLRNHSYRDRWLPRSADRATTLSDFEAEFAQGMKALTGVEVRDPTADVDLVSFCLAIPPEQFLVEDIDRSLIRRAMWGLVPESILTRRTRGVQASDWYEKLSAQREEFAKQIEVLRASPRVLRILDIDRLVASIDAWPSEGWEERRVEQEYRFVFARALAAARFLHWLDSTSIQT